MTVPAVARTLDLLEAFAREARPMTVSQLAKLLSVPVSSCHGIVKTLEDRGYLIELKHQGGYYVTKLLAHQAARIAAYDLVPQWLTESLQELRVVCAETVVLAKLTESGATYIDVLESPQSIRYIVKVGDSRPLHASAVGKAILGSLAPDALDDALGRIRFEKRSQRTITERSALLADLDAGRQRGWFLTRGEFLDEVIAVSVPLVLGGEHYACAIAGPYARVEPHIKRHAKLLLKSLSRPR